MHLLFNAGITVGPDTCVCNKNCSLSEISMPSLSKKRQSIDKYMTNFLDVDLV